MNNSNLKVFFDVLSDVGCCQKITVSNQGHLGSVVQRPLSVIPACAGMTAHKLLPAPARWPTVKVVTFERGQPLSLRFARFVYWHMRWKEAVSRSRDLDSNC